MSGDSMRLPEGEWPLCGAVFRPWVQRANGRQTTCTRPARHPGSDPYSDGQHRSDHWSGGSTTWSASQSLSIPLDGVMYEMSRDDVASLLAAAGAR